MEYKEKPKKIEKLTKTDRNRLTIVVETGRFCSFGYIKTEIL